MNSERYEIIPNFLRIQPKETKPIEVKLKMSK